MSQLWFARWLSLGIGFLSLSQEILLVRLVGFVHHSTPRAFAFVLFFFLFGIAIGAHVGKRICASKSDPVRALAIVLFAGGLLDLAIPYITAPLVAAEFEMMLAFVIFAAAALKSVAFPIAHHLGSGTDQSRLGRLVSTVYFFNIIGATLGPLLTGFVLLQYLALERILLLVAVGTLGFGMWCAARTRATWITWPAALGAIACTTLLAAEPTLIKDIVSGANPEKQVAQVVENRAGIVHVVHYDKGGDSTYGGNVYDGRINTDLRINSNGIHRVYVLAGLHPAPRRVLVIGMSSGAWISILSRMPDVEAIDVVEINPGYLDVIRMYPEVREILDDPKISIHIDDGRRWLRRHAGESYDLIVINTTWSWRAYTTNLLSVEFLREMRRHLRPGGVAAYNSTEQPDVFKTAAQVFPFVRKYASFVYVAEHDFLAGFQRNRERIWRYGPPGMPVFDPNNQSDAKLIDDVISVRRFQTLEDVELAARRPLEVISDDNLITEFKYGWFQFLFPGFN